MVLPQKILTSKVTLFLNLTLSNIALSPKTVDMNLTFFLNSVLWNIVSCVNIISDKSESFSNTTLVKSAFLQNWQDAKFTLD